MENISAQQKLKEFKKKFKGTWSDEVEKVVDRYDFIINNKIVHTFDSLIILLISNMNNWNYNKLVEYQTYVEQIRTKIESVIDSRQILTIEDVNVGIKGIAKSTLSNFSLVRTRGFDIFEKENYDIVSVEFLENIRNLFRSELDASNYIIIFNYLVLGNGECATSPEGLRQINIYHVKN